MPHFTCTQVLSCHLIERKESSAQHKDRQILSYYIKIKSYICFHKPSVFWLESLKHYELDFITWFKTLPVLLCFRPINAEFWGSAIESCDLRSCLRPSGVQLHHPESRSWWCSCPGQWGSESAVVASQRGESKCMVWSGGVKTTHSLLQAFRLFCRPSELSFSSYMSLHLYFILFYISLYKFTFLCSVQKKLFLIKNALFMRMFNKL